MGLYKNIIDNYIIMSQRLYDAIPTILKNIGIDHVFGIPGLQNIKLYEGFRNQNITSVTVTNEQNAGFMCQGYYEVSGKIPCLNVLGGPGFTHAIPGIVDAMLKNIPLFIIITGCKLETSNKFQIHDVDNEKISGCFCKYQKNIKKVDTFANDIIETYNKCIELSGPSCIIIPADFFDKKIEIGKLEKINKVLFNGKIDKNKFISSNELHLQKILSQINFDCHLFCDSKLPVRELSMFCEKNNTQLISPYACKIWGACISYMVGASYVSNKPLIGFTTPNSLVVSGMEHIISNSLMTIFIVNDKKLLINIHDYALGTEFKYIKIGINDVVPHIIFSDKYIVEIELIENVQTPNNIEPKLCNLVINYFINILRKNNIDTILYDKLSYQNKYFCNIIDLFKNHMRAIEFVSGQSLSFSGSNDRKKMLTIVSNINDAPYFFSGLGEAFMDNVYLLMLVIEKTPVVNIDNALSSLSHMFNIIDHNNISDLFRIVNTDCADCIGPNIIKINYDLFTNSNICIPDICIPNIVSKKNLTLDENTVANIVNSLNCSNNTIFYVGKGCKAYSKELTNLIEKIGAYVCSTPSGKGIIFEHHPQYLSCGICTCEDKHIGSIDVLIVLGAKLSEMTLGHYRYNTTAKKIYHIDKNNVFGNLDSINIMCDVGTFIDNIIDKINVINKKHINTNLKSNDLVITNKNKVTPKNLCIELQKRSNNSTMFVSDSGNSTLVATEHLKLEKPNFVGPMDYSSMGYSVPTGIGLALSNLNTVICFEGDGAFLMTGNEIITAKKYGLPIMLVIFRDNELGMMSAIQRSMHKNPFGTIIPNYFVKNISDAFGIKYISIKNDTELYMLDNAFTIVNNNEPVIVEVNIDYSFPFTFVENISRLPTIQNNNKYLQPIVPQQIKKSLSISYFNNIWNILKKANRLFSQKIAIKDTHYDKQFTYSELFNITCQIANFFKETVGSNNNIGVMLNNCFHIIPIHYAAAGTNNIIVNVNTRLKSNELEYIFEKSNISILIAGEEFKKEIENINIIKQKIIYISDNANNCDFIKLTQNYKKDFEEIHFDDNCGYQLYFTSGTTGKPKKVVLTHKNVFLHMLGITIEMKITETDIWAHIAPMFHLVDSFAIFAISYVGGTHVIQKNFTVNKTLDLFFNHQITITNLATTMGQMIAKSNYGKNFKYCMRIMSCGGSPIDQQSIECIINLFRCEFFVSYGMTESCGKISMSMLTNEIKNSGSVNVNKYINTSGKQFGLVDVKLVNKDNIIISNNNEDIGEIQIKGSTVFSGYDNIKDNTESFCDGWFKTGDLGKIDNKGYITIMDRKKDMILCGSENVYCVEVENIIAQINGIKKVAVFGLLDAEFGEIVCAAIVVNNNLVNDDEIFFYCKKKLANFKIPRNIYYVNDFPYTGSGKVDKKRLNKNVFQISQISQIINTNKMTQQPQKFSYWKTNLIKYEISHNVKINNIDKNVQFVLPIEFDIIGTNKKDLIYYSDEKHFFEIIKTLNNVVTFVITKGIYSQPYIPISDSILSMIRSYVSETGKDIYIVDIAKKTINFELLLNLQNKNGIYEFFIDNNNNVYTTTLSYNDCECNEINVGASNDFILVTGGTGGIGKHVINKLTSEGHNVISLVRKSTDVTNNNCVLVDFNNIADVTEKLLSVNDRGNCKFFIHMMGVLDDGLIENMKYDDFNKVIHPKVTILNNLYKVFDNINFLIEKTILFSSVYSLFGYPQLTHYAFANGYLNGISKMKTNTISINWGTWDDAGMAHRLGNKFKNFWESQGMNFLSLENGLNYLVNIMNSTITGEIGIFDFDEKKYPFNISKPSFLIKLTNSVQKEVKIGDNEIYKKVIDIIRKFVKDGTQIELTNNFVHLGVDSLDRTTIKNIIEKDFNITITNSDFYSINTINDLCNILLSKNVDELHNDNITCIDDIEHKQLVLPCVVAKSDSMVKMEITRPIDLQQTEMFDNMITTNTGSIISKYAFIGDNCKIGRNCRIGKNVIIHNDTIIGDNCVIDSEYEENNGSGTFSVIIGQKNKLMNGCIITGNTKIGEENVFYPYCVVGMKPNFKLKHFIGGNIEIGSNNIFKEYVCVHSPAICSDDTLLNQTTMIGCDNLFMNGSHIGHNSTVENNVTITCNVILAGWSKILHHSNLGINSSVQQHCIVGPYCMIGANTTVHCNILPYHTFTNRRDTDGFHDQINYVGLERGGVFVQDIDVFENNLKNNGIMFVINTKDTTCWYYNDFKKYKFYLTKQLSKKKFGKNSYSN